MRLVEALAFQEFRELRFRLRELFLRTSRPIHVEVGCAGLETFDPVQVAERGRKIHRFFELQEFSLRFRWFRRRRFRCCIRHFHIECAFRRVETPVLDTTLSARAGGREQQNPLQHDATHKPLG